MKGSIPTDNEGFDDTSQSGGLVPSLLGINSGLLNPQTNTTPTDDSFNPDEKDGWTHDGYGAYVASKQQTMPTIGQSQRNQPILAPLIQPEKDWVNSNIKQPIGNYLSGMFSSNKQPSDNDPTVDQD